MTRIELAREEVLEAARCVVNSYRASGGYTLPLSVNLRRLTTAQAELDAAVYVDHRDRLNAGQELSDNAGWDRSVLWGGTNPPESLAAAEVDVLSRPQSSSAAAGDSVEKQAEDAA